jgi:hypothetical protein
VCKNSGSVTTSSLSQAISQLPDVVVIPSCNFQNPLSSSLQNGSVSKQRSEPACRLFLQEHLLRRQMTHIALTLTCD